MDTDEEGELGVGPEEGGTRKRNEKEEEKEERERVTRKIKRKEKD